MTIHPLSAVSDQAQLGNDLTIGPFCVVEADTIIGDRCQLAAGVVIKSGTILGPDNVVAEGAVLGGYPQHVSVPKDLGSLVIGHGNTIRELVTIHRALSAGDATTIGDNNLIMVATHVAHDCRLGDRTILANNVMLAGHVAIADQAYLSGAVGVHQFCRIGSLAMVGGQAHVVKDVPPYMMVDGETTSIVGLNRVGLRRAGFDVGDVRQLKAAYQLIYREGLPWSEIVERLAAEFTTGPAASLHRFFAAGTRGFTPARAVPKTATLRLLSDDRSSFETVKKAG